MMSYKFLYVVVIFLIIGSIGYSSGISFSASSGTGTITQDVISPLESSYSSKAYIGEGSIFSNTEVKGPAKITSGQKGGDETVYTSANADDLGIFQYASEKGVAGELKANGEVMLSQYDERFLAENPDLSIGISGLTVGGKSVTITGSPYPASYDPTSVWFLAGTTKYNTVAGNTMYSGSLGGYKQLNLNTQRAALANAENQWNAAAGGPVFDGITSSSQVAIKYDFVNSILMIPQSSQMVASTKIIYGTTNRLVHDTDITLYDPWINYYNNLDWMTTFFLHELGHSGGLNHDPYNPTRIMWPQMKSTPQTTLSDLDKRIMNVKYSN